MNACLTGSEELAGSGERLVEGEAQPGAVLGDLRALERRGDYVHGGIVLDGEVGEGFELVSCGVSERVVAAVSLL